MNVRDDLFEYEDCLPDGDSLRLAKLMELKAAIQSGTYDVDTQLNEFLSRFEVNLERKEE